MNRDLIKQKEQEEQAKELAFALQRLMNQSLDFKKVFLEGYLQNEALRLVYLSGDESHREEAVKGIEAIYRLKKFMDQTLLVGELAIDNLSEIEAYEENYE